MFGLDSLVSVTIPPSVTNIEFRAFEYCSSLTSINLSSGVTSFDVSAFGGCDSLAFFDVASDNTAYSVIDGVLFNKDATELMRYPPAKAGASLF